MSLRTIIVVLSTMLPAAAYGQTARAFAQPVREVDRDARSSITGECDLRIEPGSSSVSSPCQIFLASGGLLKTLAPGQTLVIEDTSVQLAKSPVDTIHSVSLRLGFNRVRYIPLINQGTGNNTDRLMGFVSGRFYSQRSDVFANLTLALSAKGFANAHVVFTGFLVDEYQP